MLRDLLRRLLPLDPAHARPVRAAEIVAADRLIAEARSAEDARDLGQACQRYREAVALAPRYPAAHLNLGVGLEAAGDDDSALRSYETVLAIDPGNAYASFNLGKLHYRKRMFSQAERFLHAALERKPEFPEAHVVLSNIHDARGEYEKAASALQTALRQRPDYAGAWFNYATTLVRLDRYGEAEDAAR